MLILSDRLAQDNSELLRYFAVAVFVNPQLISVTGPSAPHPIPTTWAFNGFFWVFRRIGGEAGQECAEGSDKRIQLAKTRGEANRALQKPAKGIGVSRRIGGCLLPNAAAT